jgi:hypothetical protein
MDDGMTDLRGLDDPVASHLEEVRNPSWVTGAAGHMSLVLPGL